jgi:hypothetical protein
MADLSDDLDGYDLQCVSRRWPHPAQSGTDGVNPDRGAFAEAAMLAGLHAGLRWCPNTPRGIRRACCPVSTILCLD